MATVVTSRRRVERPGFAVLGAALVVLYLPVLRDLVAVWATVPFYTHGFVVPIFSAYLARDVLKHAGRADDRARAPSAEAAGLAVTLAGLAMLTLGVIHASLSLRALSIPVVLMGLALARLGPASARQLTFPIGFLVFMAPLPDRVVTAISPPLQHAAAVFAEHALRTLGIPTVRQELFVKIPSVTLHVTEDCTGIRFLLAMLVIGVACAGLTQRRPVRRVVIVLAAAGLAVLANWLRVAGTGVMSELWGAWAAIGLPHIVWGKVIYGVMLVPFAGLVLLLRRRP